MRTIRRYVFRSMMVSFSTTLLVVTFVMSLGFFFKLTELAVKGVAAGPMLMVLLSGMPQALAFSIPVSILVACLLVFGRLSADGEITAMKASGVSLWQVVRGPLGFGIVLAVISVGVNQYLQPKSHLLRRQMIARLNMEKPIELLEEGRWIQDFDGMTIYVERRKGNQMRNVRIIDMRQKNIRREIRADSGEITQGKKSGVLVLSLYRVRIDPFSEQTPGPAFSDRWTVKLEGESRQRTYRPKEDDLTFPELMDAIHRPHAYAPHLKGKDLVNQSSRFNVEMHKRFVLSLACVAFVLLAVPLGIKAHRKESSVGVAISMILVFMFYLCLILAESLSRHPEWRPHLLAWVPVFLASGLGIWLIRRAD